MSNSNSCIESYELDAWIGALGSVPVEQICHVDLSASYEMTAGRVFRLENGIYALVTESGCSCYSLDQADIELFKTKTAAIEAFEKWEKANKQ